MQIPFSLPLIDQAVLDEVQDCLLRTGWLTSGPKVLELEAETRRLSGARAVVCVNSWTSGAMLMLRWFGVGPGDEVIIPAYTYSATALCALNMGAKVVMVDVREDFTIDPVLLSRAITPRTKVVIPVDIGGWMADYDAIYAVINAQQAQFVPESPEQEKLGRILILADAAHSIGAQYRHKPCGQCADATVMSFHSVKNVTTGEGGAVCLQLPDAFEPNETYRYLKALALNGQTKSAFEKNQLGGWRYDIIAQGLKVNLPDICAAVGLAQIRRYTHELLPDRYRIFEQYRQGFSECDWAIMPVLKDNLGSCSSAHLFMLRIRHASESQRDEIIRLISEQGVGVNVHYIPMPMLSLFKSLGYQMEHYPNTYALYANEITLPLYNGLNATQTAYVVETVKQAVEAVMPGV